MALIELKNVSYSYPQSEANILENVSVSINRGEYVSVVGMNGSGKSTLARLMAGFFNPVSGEIVKAEETLCGIVFQQPKEQIIAGVVERDTAFGPQNLSMSKSEIELRTIECLSVTSMADKALSRTFELSLGQTQRIAFSGILALFPDILILDEVTSMLDEEARKSLLEFVSQWNSKGHTVIQITHDFDEVQKSNRVIVLSGGKVAYDGTEKSFEENKEIYDSIFLPQDELKSFLRKNKELKKEKNCDIALSVQNVSCCYGDACAFENVSFDVKKGSLVAITGPSGCGKSTLFECIAGLRDVSSGTIYACSRPSLALQDSESALFEPFACDDVAFGPENNGINGKKLLESVKKSMEMAGIPYENFAERSTFNLSGGEKKKLSLAGIIALDREIMIFDEPTAGLDASSRKYILETLRQLSDSGKTVLFSTHRIEESAVADEIINWSDIKDNVVAEKKMSLAEQKIIPNARILKTLSGISASFMAPPKIPESIISHVHPLGKFLLFIALFLSALIFSGYKNLAVVLFLSVTYSLLAKNPLKNPLSAIKNLLPFIFMFALLEILFYPIYKGDKILFEFGKYAFTDRKLNFILRTFLRSSCSIFLISAFLFSTSEREIMDGLGCLLAPLGLLRIPVRHLVLVAGIIFRFIPLLMDELSGIIKTQIVRGAFGNAKGLKKIKMLVPVFVPLVLQTFRKAQYLADALTARYFK